MLLYLLALDGFSALAFAAAHAIGMEKRITQHDGRSGRPVQKPRFMPAEGVLAMARKRVASEQPRYV